LGVPYLLEADGTSEDLHESFTPEEFKTTFLLAFSGHVITLAGYPINVNKELPQSVDTDVLPLGPLLSSWSARGVNHIADGIRHLTDWRHFNDILEVAPGHVRAKLLIHSGHGSVSILLLDISHANNVPCFDGGGMHHDPKSNGSPGARAPTNGTHFGLLGVRHEGKRPGIHGETCVPLPKWSRSQVYSSLAYRKCYMRQGYPLQRR
jgi:hypothetical protein